jgi:hypothetical protein
VRALPAAKLFAGDCGAFRSSPTVLPVLGRVDSGVVRSSFSVWGLLLNCSIERVCTAKLGEFCQKKIDLFLIGQGDG